MNRLIIVISLLLSVQTSAQIRIWDGTSHKEENVVLNEYKTAGQAKGSIIICPGGSYFWHDMKGEGSKVAEWLSSEGYNAYVLKYRVAGTFDFITRFRRVARGSRFPDMICDLQRSIQVIRDRNGDQYIGVMGFSAGGHLALMSAAFGETDYVSGCGVDSGSMSLKPDFIAAIYPVVTMSNNNYVHKRSRRGLLGEDAAGNQALQDSLSMEKHVTPAMPPVFLLNCEDDPTVDWHNSVILDSALTAERVPHKYLRFKSGGHGFGADRKKYTAETGGWQKEFIKWLNDYGY